MGLELTCTKMERRGAVGIAIMNRPDKLNAMNTQLSNEMVDIIEEFEADPEIRAIVITGAGERAFSAGGDMKEQRERLGEGAAASNRRGLTERVRTCTKPTLAAIRGYCYGGASVLAVNCDIRILGEDARFKFVGVAYGLAPGSAMLPRIVGEAKAKELLFTADVVDAPEALRIGLANHVVPAADVLEYTVAMAERIAANSADAVQGAKRVVNVALSVEEAVESEGELTKQLRSTAEMQDRFRAAANRVVGVG
ncbi:MAG: enoyl-CoA hydratase/isomerase family protein [Chloroflexota bacterium]